MAHKITENVGNKAEVVNSRFSVRSFDESLLRSGGGEHNLHKRRRQRALEMVMNYMKLSLSGMKSQYNKFNAGDSFFKLSL